ncbi:MAG: HEAT repeat domain-containing protein [Candidatus Nanoarchaeia archaeon]
MEADLIQKLRTSPVGERNIARELANIGSRKAVAELKKMVEGKIKAYSLRTYKTFWLKRPIRYSPHEQRIGIEALGETRSPDALDYLRRLYTYEIFKEGRESHVVQGIDPIHDYWQVEIYRYPNAPAGLGDNLSYEVAITSSSWGCESDIPEEKIEASRKWTPNNREIHLIFRTAISKLESSIPNTSNP